MGRLTFFGTRIEGSTPIQKWFNLIHKWNRLDTFCRDEGTLQQKLILKGEAKNLIKQYPDIFNELIFHLEENYIELECMIYGGYKPQFKFPKKLKKPIEGDVKLF